MVSSAVYAILSGQVSVHISDLEVDHLAAFKEEARGQILVTEIPNPSTCGVEASQFCSESYFSSPNNLESWLVEKVIFHQQLLLYVNIQIVVILC